MNRDRSVCVCVFECLCVFECAPVCVFMCVYVSGWPFVWIKEAKRGDNTWTGGREGTRLKREAVQRADRRLW